MFYWGLSFPHELAQSGAKVLNSKFQAQNFSWCTKKKESVLLRIPQTDLSKCSLFMIGRHNNRSKRFKSPILFQCIKKTKKIQIPSFNIFLAHWGPSFPDRLAQSGAKNIKFPIPNTNFFLVHEKPKERFCCGFREQTSVSWVLSLPDGLTQ